MTPEDFNKWRVWPRLLTGAFSLFFFYAWFYVVDWFITFNWQTVDNQAVALALAGFPAAILTVITIVLGKLIDKYMNGTTP